MRQQRSHFCILLRLFALAALSFALNGCRTLSGGSGDPPDARAVAPPASGSLRAMAPVADPAVAALQPQALQDVNTLLAHGEALFAPGQGIACPIVYPLGAINRQLRVKGLPPEQPPLEYTLTMLSGACPRHDPETGGLEFDGPVRYILVTHKRISTSEADYDDVLFQERHTGTYVGGVPVGQHQELSRTLYRQYRRLLSGEYVEMNPRGRDAGKPVYSVLYRNHAASPAADQAAAPAGGSVDFFSPDWLAVPQETTVTVASYPDATRRVVTVYQNGELARRFRAKKINGQYLLHGWYEFIHPKKKRLCYQNAVQINAIACDDS